jgi:hypothetical protein
MILSNVANMFTPSSNMASDHEKPHVILQASRFDSKMKNMRCHLINHWQGPKEGEMVRVLMESLHLNIKAISYHFDFSKYSKDKKNK